MRENWVAKHFVSFFTNHWPLTSVRWGLVAWIASLHVFVNILGLSEEKNKTKHSHPFCHFFFVLNARKRDINICISHYSVPKTEYFDLGEDKGGINSSFYLSSENMNGKYVLSINIYWRCIKPWCVVVQLSLI